MLQYKELNFWGVVIDLLEKMCQEVSVFSDVIK